MSSRILKTLLLCLALVAITVPAFFCNSPKGEEEAQRAGGLSSPWRNVYDTSVHYVGMTACRNCHYQVYESFMQTGMGESFDVASRSKSAGDFQPGHALVYDREKDFYYHPFWDKDSLTILEYRLEGKDTVHQRKEVVSYIIGSGQHTNSHILNFNGYFYQAPITFYTQSKRWDLAPGFENGASSRFSRMIESECMTCHNGYPDFVSNSQNKFTNVQHGIDCERCHGPGSLHVAEKSSGKIVDTSKGPDYSIVNPRRLSTELQNNVCQRCHLQGIAVLNDGKNFFDFRPGMHLSEVMNVFMPQYEGADDKMIMASHVERMKKSDCFISSGKMSCITCHNPHVSVKFTPKEQYLNACGSCHGGTQQVHCSEKPEIRAKKGNDCISCHMPKNGSIDIPHVAVTDHYIRRRPLDDKSKGKITAFLGLECFNNDKVDAITTARAYMEFYERYNPNNKLIDSAIIWLGRQQGDEEKLKQNKDYIRAYYLLENFRKVIDYAAALKPEKVTDAWTAYRIGEGFNQLQQPQKALIWYARAVAIWPYSLNFQNKYGTCQLSLGQMKEAEQTFTYVLQQNPKHAEANSNLGYVYLQQQDLVKAFDYLSRSLALDPDYEFTLINLAVYYHGQGNDAMAKKNLQSLLKRHPENARAKAMLEDL